MSPKPAEPAVDAEHRRWLIGLGISVSFGLFGAVMAWLSYSAKTRPLAPAAVQVTAPTSGGADPAKRRHHSPRDRD
jgi:hypothetical protein